MNIDLESSIRETANDDGLPHEGGAHFDEESFYFGDDEGACYEAGLNPGKF